MIVMKFGGTSVESAAAIERVASIVRARLKRRPVLVVSAMGKTTNQLLAIAAEAVEGNRTAALELLARLQEFHLSEARQLVAADGQDGLEDALNGLFQEWEELTKATTVMGELPPRASDAVVSYGQRLSSQIVTFAPEALDIPAVHVDARDVIVTDDRHTH